MSTYLNNQVKISELDFATIKSNLVTFLKNQSQFSDYDFEGSALSTLIDLLAFNTVYNSFYLNMGVNESFLDTALLRENVVSRAKDLNYIPSSVTGANAIITLSITPTGTDDSTYLNMDKFTKFITTIDGNDYIFSTIENQTLFRNDDGIFYGDGIIIKEGEPVLYSHTVNSVINGVKVILPNKNVDISTIEVNVETVSGEILNYTLAGDTNVITGDDTVYWVQENKEGYYEIYFGDDVVGRQPGINSIIRVEYLVSNGEVGNKAFVFTLVDTIDGYSEGITITVESSASGGVDRESIQSIKFLAPKVYESQNRCVTVNDYKAILRRDYYNIDSLSVWGGEDNDPPSYGKVYISIKPVYGFVLTDSEKSHIKDDILKTKNVVTIEPVIIDPEYTYLKIQSTVKYNPRSTIKTANQIKTLVMQAITEYNQNYLGEFDQYFRYSFLSGIIDNVDASITNNLLSVWMKKEFTPTPNVGSTITIKFNNKLYHPNDQYKNVTSTLFNMSYNDLVYNNCQLDDTDGYIYAKRVIAGTDYYIGGNTNKVVMGTIDYDTGEIVLNTNLLITNENTVTITAKPDTNDIIPMRNQLLYIKNEDIDITMYDDTNSLVL